jgi:ABC-type uncharacterized transport system permease subunit
MISLLILAFKNQLSAQMKKPFEFLTGLLSLILNNSFYLYGIYLLALLSADDNPLAAKEYLVSTGMVLTSWGFLNVFGGGLYQLGSLIETGELEAYLAKPQPTLLLVAISKSNLMSVGEILQGMITIIISSILYDSFLGIKMLVISAILVFAFASVIISIGTISFFSSRGSQISYVILQVLLSLSLFPVSRALKGREKWILYFTPLLITATLPRLIVLQGGLATFLTFIVATMLFKFGLKFYRSKNYIFINN